MYIIYFIEYAFEVMGPNVSFQVLSEHFLHAHLRFLTVMLSIFKLLETFTVLANNVSLIFFQLLTYSYR